jgi:hypothetical protein
MSKVNSIVSIKPNGKFTEDQLRIAKANLRKSSFPQFYTNKVFKSLKFEGTELIDAELINRDKVDGGSVQSVRAGGKNEAYDELRSDMLEKGYRLYGGIITVRRTNNNDGRYELVDGRTKDKILQEMKYKNRICNVIEINDVDAEDYGLRSNAGEETPPAGRIKEADLFASANRLIDNNLLELDALQIRAWIDKCCGTGKFSDKKRNDLAHFIYNRKDAVRTTGLLPQAWSSNKEVYSWLDSKKYVATSTVIYLPFAASSPMKAVFAAARLSQQNPDKEIRVVVYASKLNGFNLKKCYIDAILNFKNLWHDYMALLSNTYYDGAKPSTFNVKLYGAIPSRIADVCEDMDKLIVFGKNDAAIDPQFLSRKGLTEAILEEETEEETE